MIVIIVLNHSKIVDNWIREMNSMTISKRTTVWAMLLISIFFMAMPDEANAATKLGAVKVTSKTSTVSSITIKWKKVRRAKKYQIQAYGYDLKEYGTLVNKKTRKLSYTFKGLRSGKKYKYRIRALRGKAKGKWVTLSVTTKTKSTVTVYRKLGSDVQKVKSGTSIIGKTYTLPALEKSVTEDGIEYVFSKWEVKGGELKKSASAMENSAVLKAKDVRFTAVYKSSTNIDPEPEPTDLVFPHDDNYFSAYIVNPDKNKVYNGCGSVLPIYFKTDATLEDYGDWSGYRVPSSEALQIGDCFYEKDIKDSWEAVMMGAYRVRCYDVHYQDPDAIAQKSEADYETVDGGYLTYDIFGSIIDPLNTDTKAGKYKIIVIDWDSTGKCAKIRAISSNFYIYDIKPRLNAWIQEMLSQSEGNLTCLADYSLVNYDYEESKELAEKYPTLKKALEISKTIKKTYEYPFLDNHCGIYSIKEIQKPVIDGPKICSEASDALMIVLKHLDISCSPRIYEAADHQVTNVFIDGKAYEVDATPNIRYNLFPEEKRIHYIPKNTDIYYDYVNLGE